MESLILQKTNRKKTEEVQHIVLVAGGTGGHLFPAVSLGKFLREHGYKTTLITDNRAKKYCQPNDFDNLWLANVKRSKFVLVYLFSLFYQLLRAIKFFIKVRPNLVIGFGGYPTLAPVFAAQLLGIKTILHEQNAILGRANKFLQKKAHKVLLSFDDTLGANNHKSVLIGNFVRQEFFDCHVPYSQLNNYEKIKILVVGGSQGASIFSKVLPAGVKQLPIEIQEKLLIQQQCRKELLSHTQEGWQGFLGDVELTSFFSDMPERLAQANLVICRAGASTVTELIAAQRPAIFVPFAASLDGDQMANAKLLEKNGASWILPQEQMTPENLRDLLIKLLSNKTLLTEAASKLNDALLRNAHKNALQLINSL